MKVSLFHGKSTLKLNGALLDLCSPVVMGILNLAEDSFYDGGRYNTDAKIIKRAEQILSQGAAIIDIGACSTRPGSQLVGEEEEIQKIKNGISIIIKEFPNAWVSADTFRSSVAKVAVNEGAVIINDVSGGEMDKEMFQTVSMLNVAYILMHMRGTPRTMTKLTQYDNLLVNLIDYFQLKINQLEKLGLTEIVIDPGFGFAKTTEQNFHLLSRIGELFILERPILAGMSRKKMIYESLGVTPEEALNGTNSINMIALQNGVQMLRVHDVKEAMETIKLFNLTRR